MRCLSPPKMYILEPRTTRDWPSLAQGFFPIMNRCESSYIIYCFVSFLVISWGPIDSKVFSIDSVVGDKERLPPYSPGFSLNCFNSSFFFYRNFFCLLSVRIFFITSPVAWDCFYGDTLCKVSLYYFYGLFLFDCFKVGEQS